LGDFQFSVVLAQLIDLLQGLSQLLGLGFGGLVQGSPDGVKLLLNPCGIAALSIDLQQESALLFGCSLLGIPGRIDESGQLLALCRELLDLLFQARPQAFVVGHALFQISELFRKGCAMCLLRDKLMACVAFLLLGCSDGLVGRVHLVLGVQPDGGASLIRQ
jgi:hypothetical protein